MTMERMTPTRSDARLDALAAVIELVEPSLDRLPGYVAALVSMKIHLSETPRILMFATCIRVHHRSSFMETLY